MIKLDQPCYAMFIHFCTGYHVAPHQAILSYYNGLIRWISGSAACGDRCRWAHRAPGLLFIAAVGRTKIPCSGAHL